MGIPIGYFPESRSDDEWTLEKSMQSLKNALGYKAAEDHDGFSPDIHSTTSTNLSPGNAGDRLASKISKKETK